MHLKQAWIALFFCPLVAFAQDQRENLLAIRYLAFDASSHLLLNFNTSNGSADPLYADKYRADLQLMNDLLSQTPSPELRAEGQRFQGLILTLEQQREHEHLYPIWINPILESQARIDSLAQHLSPTGEDPDGARQQLERLTLNSQRLLLYYQTRAFGSLAVYIDAIKKGAPQSLDQAIQRDFAALRATLPKQVDELAKLERKYNFIRRQVLQMQGEFVPDSVAYYLEKIGTGSQRIAERIRSS